MGAAPGYILLDSSELPTTDSAGRVLGDASHVGRHLASRRGIATVVVPPSTVGGAPEGFDPHMIDDTVINFDPGRKTAVTMTVAQLRQQQQGKFALPGGGKVANTVVLGNVAATAPSDNAYNFEEDEPPAARPAVAGLRPMEVLQNAKKRQTTVAAVAPAAGRPDTVVTFEITGMGILQASYVDVIIQGAMLILVFDHAVSGGFCYFPDFSTAETPPTMALRVGDTGAVHLVETTGIRFKYHTLEFCVLLIAQTVEE